MWAWKASAGYPAAAGYPPLFRPTAYLIYLSPLQTVVARYIPVYTVSTTRTWSLGNTDCKRIKLRPGGKDSEYYRWEIKMEVCTCLQTKGSIKFHIYYINIKKNKKKIKKNILAQLGFELQVFRLIPHAHLASGL